MVIIIRILITLLPTDTEHPFTYSRCLFTFANSWYLCLISIMFEMISSCSLYLIRNSLFYLLQYIHQVCVNLLCLKYAYHLS